MAFRVEQSRGLVVSDEGWSFGLDCEGGVALLELDGLRLRVRPLRWSEKNRLARMAHMGEALVRQQLVRACLLDAGGLALSERQQDVVARLVLWLGGQQGGLDEGFPLDCLALAGVTLGVCRATGLKPSDLDGREAAEVEMLWLAAGGRAHAPEAHDADVHPADGLDQAGPAGSGPGPAWRSPYAQNAARDSRAPSDDFTRIVIVPDPAAAPHAPDARDVEADRHARADDPADRRDEDVRLADVRGVVNAEGHSVVGDEGRGVVGSGEEPRVFVGAEGGAVVGDFDEEVAARVKPPSEEHAARQTRVPARGAGLPKASRPASDGGAGGAPSASSAGRGRRGAARTSSNGPLAQRFRVLAAGTTFQELADAPPADRQLNRAEGGGTSEFFAEADAVPFFAEADAATRAPASPSSAAVAALGGEEPALRHATALSAEGVRGDSRAPFASDRQSDRQREGRNVASSTRRPDAPSVVRLARESTTRPVREASADEFSSYGGGPAAGARVARGQGGAALAASLPRTSAAAPRVEVDGARLPGGGPFAGTANGVRAPFVVAPATGDAGDAGARQFGQTGDGAAQSAEARERLFEELCERLAEAADELGID